MDQLMHYDIIVVGRGIAALSLLLELSQRPETINKKILNIASDSFYPGCSTRTTSIVSIGAHKKGLSPLGDLLVDSEDCFKSFAKKFSPAGLYPASQCYLLTDDIERNQKIFDRYGAQVSEFYGQQVVVKDAYVIDPDLYRNWFLEKVKNSNLDITFLDNTVDEVNSKNKKIITGDAQILTYGEIVLATGPYTSFIYQNEKLPEGKPVSGSYLTWQNCELFAEDILFSLGHFNIIYRKDKKELVFGGSSFEGHVLSHDVRELESHYQSFKDVMRAVGLPDFSEAQILTGIRHKGKKRTPFFDRLDDGVIVINSLYRNAYTFNHLAATRVLELLK
jgi:glycine/D-amino acid oxidase-like deaminating enzyme